MKLARITTPDGITLHGLDNGIDSDTCVAHIHGKCGNFYANEFVATMASEYASHNVRFVAFNHRGHDCLAEDVGAQGVVSYIGGSVVSVDAVSRDVETIFDFVSSISDRTILQGHSQGCEHVLTHAAKHLAVTDAILLSPSDSVAIQRSWRNGESVQAQVARLSTADLRPGSWLPPDEYGVNGSAPYHIPVTASSLLSVLTSDEFVSLALDEPWLASPIRARCFAYIGGADPLAVHGEAKMRDGLARRFEQVEFFCPPQGDHAMRGIAEDVTRRIVTWLGTATDIESP
jgi:pimeloyl-ACP methyl ester carboxylesterase